MSASFFITCPHCFMLIEVLYSEVNCKIFRHGAYKSNGKQIDPHLNKPTCDNLVAKDEIYGCGKPFKLEHDIEDKYIAVACDYI